MKLSIIVPVYNVEHYLSQCLDSLVKQTIDDFEIIIVDDGSTDNSGEIAQRYAENYKNLIRLFLKENGGQGSARNLGLKHACGEYVGFVDSDDWVDLDMYETMFKTAIKTTADIVICDMEDHFPNQAPIHYHISKSADKFSQTPSACNKLFRRSFIGDLRYLTDIWYEDFNFTTKLLLQTEKIAYSPSVSYHCHCRPISTMHNQNSLKNLDILKSFDDIVNSLSTMEVERYQKEIAQMAVEHILITTINRVSLHKTSEKKQVIKQLRAYMKSNYPLFKNTTIFFRLPRNRRIIALLNYFGLSSFSRFILSTKSRLAKSFGA